MTQELIEIVSQPQFEQFIQDIEIQSAETRLLYAKKMANVEELRKRGVKLPDDYKVTLRTFEGRELTREFDESPENRALLPGGWSVCIGTVITVGYQF